MEVNQMNQSTTKLIQIIHQSDPNLRKLYQNVAVPQQESLDVVELPIANAHRQNQIFDIVNSQDLQNIQAGGYKNKRKYKAGAPVINHNSNTSSNAVNSLPSPNRRQVGMPNAKQSVSNALGIESSALSPRPDDYDIAMVMVPQPSSLKDQVKAHKNLGYQLKHSSLNRKLNGNMGPQHTRNLYGGEHSQSSNRMMSSAVRSTPLSAKTVIETGIALANNQRSQMRIQSNKGSATVTQKRRKQVEIPSQKVTSTKRSAAQNQPKKTVALEAVSHLQNSNTAISPQQKPITNTGKVTINSKFTVANQQQQQQSAPSLQSDHNNISNSGIQDLVSHHVDQIASLEKDQQRAKLDLSEQQTKTFAQKSNESHKQLSRQNKALYAHYSNQKIPHVFQPVLRENSSSRENATTQLVQRGQYSHIQTQISSIETPVLKTSTSKKMSTRNFTTAKKPSMASHLVLAKANNPNTSSGTALNKASQSFKSASQLHNLQQYNKTGSIIEARQIQPTPQQSSEKVNKKVSSTQRQANQFRIMGVPTEVFKSEKDKLHTPDKPNEGAPPRSLAARLMYSSTVVNEQDVVLAEQLVPSLLPNVIIHSRASSDESKVNFESSGQPERASVLSNKQSQASKYNLLQSASPTKSNYAPPHFGSIRQPSKNYVVTPAINQAHFGVDKKGQRDSQAVLIAAARQSQQVEGEQMAMKSPKKYLPFISNQDASQVFHQQNPFEEPSTMLLPNLQFNAGDQSRKNNQDLSEQRYSEHSIFNNKADSMVLMGSRQSIQQHINQKYVADTASDKKVPFREKSSPHFESTPSMPQHAQNNQTTPFMIYPQKRRESASPQVLKSLHTEATADLVEAADLVNNNLAEYSTAKGNYETRNKEPVVAPVYASHSRLFPRQSDFKVTQRQSMIQKNPLAQSRLQVQLEPVDLLQDIRQMKRTKSTLRMSKKDPKKQELLNIPPQQFSNVMREDGLEEEKKQNLTNIGKTYLTHTRSQQNLEPSMMAFLNLLKGKEDAKQPSQPAKHKVSMHAADVSHFIGQKLQQKKKRPVGSTQKAPHKFGAAQAQTSSAHQAKKQVKLLPPSQVNRSEPTTTRTATNQPVGIYYSQNEPSFIQAENTGQFVISVAQQDQVRSINSPPLVISPRHGEMTQTQEQTQQNAQMKDNKQSLKRPTQISSAKQKLLQEKGAQRKQLASGKMHLRAKAPAEQQQQCVKQSPFPFDPFQNPGNAADFNLNKIIVSHGGQNVMISANDPVLKKYLNKQMGGLRQQGSKPESRQISHTGPSSKKTAGRSALSKKVATSSLTHNAEAANNNSCSKTDLLIVGVKDMLNQNRLVESQQHPSERRNQDQHVVPAMQQPPEDQVMIELPQKVFIQLQTSGTGSIGESQGMMIQGQASAATLPGLGLAAMQSQQSTESLQHPVTIRLSNHEQSTMLMEETPTGKTPHYLLPKMPKREISIEQAESSIEDSHMTVPADLSPIARVNKTRPVFEKVLISIKDDQRDSVVETKNRSLIKEADTKIENESVLKSQSKHDDNKNKVRLVESHLLSEEINDDLVNSDSIKKFQEETQAAWKKTYFLPSMGDKKGKETYRLFFRRRHTVECTNLIIIRASDFLVTAWRDFGEDSSCERLMVQPDALRLVSKLLATNQVAILIDLGSPAFTDWIRQVLMEQLKLQVDAIYSFNGQSKPSGLLIDVTQIVNDFRLFSEFQQSYKKTLVNPSLFTFVEIGFKGGKPSQLAFNGRLAHNYTHVEAGQFSAMTVGSPTVSDPESEEPTINEGYKALLDFLVEDYKDNLSACIIKTLVIVERQQQEIRQQTRRSLKDYKIASINRASFGKLQPAALSIGSDDAANTLIAEMRQRNVNVQRRRANYASKVAEQYRVQTLQGGNRPLSTLNIDEIVDTVTFRNEEWDSDAQMSINQLGTATQQHAIANLQASDAGSMVNLHNPFKGSSGLVQACSINENQLAQTELMTSQASGTFVNLMSSGIQSVANLTPLQVHEVNQLDQLNKNLGSQTNQLYPEVITRDTQKMVVGSFVDTNSVHGLAHQKNLKQFSLFQFGEPIVPQMVKDDAFVLVASRIFKHTRISGKITDWLCEEQRVARGEPKNNFSSQMINCQSMERDSNTVVTGDDYQAGSPAKRSLRRTMTTDNNQPRNKVTLATPSRRLNFY